MQTAVLDAPASYVAGQEIYPGRQPSDVRTGIVQTAAIPAGRFVAKGTSDRQVILPAAATDITTTAFQGVAKYDPTEEPGGFAVGAAIPVATKGTYAVPALAGTYTKGQAVNVYYTASNNGKIAASAVASNTAVCTWAEVAESKTLAAEGLIAVTLNR